MCLQLSGLQWCDSSWQTLSSGAPGLWPWNPLVISYESCVQRYRFQVWIVFYSCERGHECRCFDHQWIAGPVQLYFIATKGKGLGVKFALYHIFRGILMQLTERGWCVPEICERSHVRHLYVMLLSARSLLWKSRHRTHSNAFSAWSWRVCSSGTVQQTICCSTERHVTIVYLESISSAFGVQDNAMALNSKTAKCNGLRL